MRILVRISLIVGIVSLLATTFGGAGLSQAQASLNASCCRVCTNSCACGDSCISCSKTCRVPAGCACNGGGGGGCGGS